jgi:hypothetical protein
MDEVHQTGLPTYVSPIIMPTRWFDRLLEIPSMQLADMPDILIRQG